MDPGQLALIAKLRLAGCVFAEQEAALLTDTASSPADLAELVARRLAGEPLEQVLGWVEFNRQRISLRPGVFVPRRRTELLVSEAVDHAQSADIVVDLCCGSGAVGIGIATTVPSIDLYAVDIDEVAVRCTRDNLMKFGCTGQAYQGDLYHPLPPRLQHKVNLVVANAPYVPSDSIALMPPEARLFEPRIALDGGVDGLTLHRRIITAAPDWLADGGYLLMECSVHQLDQLQHLLVDNGFAAEPRTKDDLGAAIVIGRWLVSPCA